MLSYRLDRDVSCEELCKSLQLMFQKMRDNNIDISNKILKVEVVDIVQTVDTFQPKIEYKEI